MAKEQWKADDRVMSDFGGELFKGSIVSLSKTKAKVLFDDGETHNIKLEDLIRLRAKKKNLGSKAKPRTKEEKGGQGFNQYKIVWNGVNFKVKVDDGEFYGWWRKIRVKDSDLDGYGIDIMVRYEEHMYNVETIRYLEVDPREDQESLDADICAAVNKWLHYKCKGTFDTIEDLQQRAEKPVIRISQLSTIDKIIIDLKAYRDTALRCGGRRTMAMEGDYADTEPSMRIELDLSSQAATLKGSRVPPVGEGLLFDNVARDKSKGGKGRKTMATKSVGNPENIKDFLKRLEKTTDKGERRKLRAALRKMGHTGGTRQKPEKSQKPEKTNKPKKKKKAKKSKKSKK